MEFLEEPITIENFRLTLLHSIFGGKEQVKTIELTEEDWTNIHSLSKERYANWEWNYGKSPAFNMSHSERFPIGGIDVRLQVKNGVIEDAHIYGDFFGLGDVSDVETHLIGVNYERSAIAESLENPDISTYLGGITKEEFLQLIY
jgi:lipoate-protein ligase A